MLFKPQTPGAVQIVIRVGAEGDHGLGAGDARDLGDLFGDYFGEALEVRDADHDDEVVGARDRVGLGDAFYGEHGLGGLLDALAFGPDEDDGRYHAHPLYPKLHRSREGVVGRGLLVLDRAHLDGNPCGLVELAGDKAANLDRGRLLGFQVRYGLALGLALGGGVQDDLHVDARLGHLAAVRHPHGEYWLVGARQDHVPALIKWFTRDLHGRDLHPVQGIRVALCRSRYWCRVEAERAVIHKRLQLPEVGLITGLPRDLQGALDGRNVKVGDDGVARPVVSHGRRKFSFEPVLIPRSRLRKIVRGLGSYAQHRDDVMVRVLELRRDPLLLQRLLVLLFGAVGHLGER